MFTTAVRQTGKGADLGQARHCAMQAAFGKKQCICRQVDTCSRQGCKDGVQ